MILRLTDELTAAEEFAASSAAEFRARAAAAESRLRRRGIRDVYLHVATDNGEWIPPGYPQSNQRVKLSAWKLSSAEMASIYNMCVASNAAGTRADFEFRRLSEWVTE